MSFLKKLFGIPAKQRTLLDESRDVSGRLIVRGYRRIAAQLGCAPTQMTSDRKIMEIYSMVGTAFNEAAKRRGEHIPASFKNAIAFKFFQVYESMGQEVMEEHLEYEIAKYSQEGLRPDYKVTLELFDQNSDDPDVRRLLELQKLARDKMNTQGA
jgi:hypothetical protein